MPKRLDMSWYEAICLSASGMEIVFKTTSELAKFMGLVPMGIAQGGGFKYYCPGDNVFTMDVLLGRYAVDLLNITRTITAERLFGALVEFDWSSVPRVQGRDQRP